MVSSSIIIFVSFYFFFLLEYPVEWAYQSVIRSGADVSSVGWKKKLEFQRQKNTCKSIYTRLLLELSWHKAIFFRRSLSSFMYCTYLVINLRKYKSYSFLRYIFQRIMALNNFDLVRWTIRRPSVTNCMTKEEKVNQLFFISDTFEYVFKSVARHNNTFS